MEGAADAGRCAGSRDGEGEECGVPGISRWEDGRWEDGSWGGCESWLGRWVVEWLGGCRGGAAACGARGRFDRESEYEGDGAAGLTYSLQPTAYGLPWAGAGRCPIGRTHVRTSYVRTSSPARERWAGGAGADRRADEVSNLAASRRPACGCGQRRRSSRFSFDLRTPYRTCILRAAGRNGFLDAMLLALFRLR